MYSGRYVLRGEQLTVTSKSGQMSTSIEIDGPVDIIARILLSDIVRAAAAAEVSTTG